MNCIRNSVCSGAWALLAAGCASTPAQPPVAAPAPPPPLAVASAPVIPASGTTVSAKAAAAVGTHEALVKSARTMGYRLRQDKNGDAVYCHTEAELGSRFEKTNCVTEDIMKQRVQDMIDTQDYMRNAPNKCAGGSCESTH